MMTKRNLETWRRLSRLELLDLIQELSSASMATIDKWPATGEGRRLKQACEQAVGTLDLTNLSKLASGLQEIESVVGALSDATDSDYYRQYIYPRKLKSVRWNGKVLGEVVSETLSQTSSFISVNRPALVPVAPTSAEAIVISPVSDSLAKITPRQQLGPLQFEYSDGAIRIKRQNAKASRQNSAAAEQARVQLAKDADWLVENLARSNVDQRAVSMMEEMGQHLSSSQDVIQIGLVNLACDNLAANLGEEVAAPVAAKWRGFSVGVSLYVGQFPEWHQFVDNASDRDVRPVDAQRAFQVGKQLVADIKRTADLADPEVPRSIELLLEAISDPQKAARRAVFAVIRTIENFVAKIFSEFGSFISASLDGGKTGVKKVVGGAVVIVALSIAASSASQISSSAQHVLKTDWLAKAAHIVSNALESAE